MYVTGQTDSADFPIVNALHATFNGQTAFVTKLNPSGSGILYSTYIPTAASASTVIYGVTADSTDDVYLTGRTTSPDFPTTPGAFNTSYNGGAGDAIVMKLNSFGSQVLYSTFLGGSGDDTAISIVVDTQGNAYVTGSTNSPNFPMTAGAFQTNFNGGFADVFISKLNAAGSALVYSTYLGGSFSDAGESIAVDATGNAYVVGETTSFDFPTTVGAFDTSPPVGGTYDAFVAKISDTAPPLPQPVLSVTPTSLDFGTVAVGSAKDLEFTVTNTGDGTLTGTASASSPFSIVSGGSFSLGAGTSQAVVVRFSPTAGGSFGGNVSFTSNGGDASQVVTGTGETAPAIGVTPASLDFGSVPVRSSADRTFTVQNTGGGALAGTCNTAVPFSLPNGCSFNLTSGQTVVVTVRFSPTAAGSSVGNVSFSSNGGNSLLAIQGVGTAVVVGGRCDRALFRATHRVVCGLLNQLRQPAYFNIPPSAASDNQLISYIGEHTDAIAVLVRQVDYGRELEAFVKQQGSLLNRREREFLNALGGAQGLTDVLQPIVEILSITTEAWPLV